jgi:hypothetical protein
MERGTNNTNIFKILVSESHIIAILEAGLNWR